MIDEVAGHHKCAHCGTLLKDVAYTDVHKTKDAFCNANCFHNRLAYVNVDKLEFATDALVRVFYMEFDLHNGWQQTCTEPMTEEQALSIADKLRKSGNVARIIGEKWLNEEND